MFIVMVIVSVFLLNAILLYIQKQLYSPGSDHPYHLGLINGIRTNKHKFVKSYPNMIGENNFAYPQLLHWILSFLPISALKDHYNYVGLAINYLLLITFLGINIWTYDILKPQISFELYTLLAALLFIITPFSWAPWNAKNTGISARGLALLLGYLYQYIIILYYYSEHWTYLALLLVIVYVIILSSQFATQYVIFSMPLYALLYSNYYLLLFPFIAYLVFYVFNKEIASNYIKGQIWHKTIYFRYLAKLFLLDKRESIWRDLIYDIWVKIYRKPPRGLLYAYNNPFVAIMIAIPGLGYLAFSFVRNNINIVHSLEQLMIWNVLIAITLFVLTSFTKTRFLGEPERYVEFALPFIIMLVIRFNEKSLHVIWIIFAISTLLLILQFYYPILIKKLKPSDIEVNIGKKINDILLTIKMEHDELRVFSNNKEFSKYGLATGAGILLTNLTSFYTGKHSFVELFPIKYPEMSNKVIVSLIKEFEINCFILDTNNRQYIDILSIENLGFMEYYNSDKFVVYMRK
jgi:hypothetical protein